MVPHGFRTRALFFSVGLASLWNLGKKIVFPTLNEHLTSHTQVLFLQVFLLLIPFNFLGLPKLARHYTFRQSFVDKELKKHSMLSKNSLMLSAFKLNMLKYKERSKNPLIAIFYLGLVDLSIKESIFTFRHIQGILKENEMQV